MIDGNRDGTFTLYCYEGDDCVWEQTYQTNDAAMSYGKRFLDGEFKGGFPTLND